MKRILLALALFLLPSIAMAQCNGVFPTNTVCGNSSGSSNLPKPVPPNSFTVGPAGTSGQIQYNNAGSFGGFTPGGDLTFANPNFTINALAVTAAKIANKTGTGTNIPTSTGSLASGDCVKIDANGNFVDAGAACGTGASIYITPASSGITCDGVTDVSAAFQTMVTGAAGKTIFLPAGPACVIGTTIALPSNTHITGASREMSVMLSKAGNSPMFSATNVSNIELDHFWCQGTDNATAWAGAPVGCLNFSQNASAVTTGKNLNIHDMKFTAFNSTYWVFVNTSGSTFPLADINIQNNYVITVSADIPTDGVPTNDTNGVFVLQTATAGNGQIQNTQIKNNRIDANSVCFPIILYSNHFRWQVTENLILNPGQTSNTHCNNAGATTINAYGILVYDVNADGNPPNVGLVANNTIYAPYSDGIYFAGDGAHFTDGFNDFQADIVGNVITLQTSSDESQLARAGIYLNGATDVNIVGNFLQQNFGGITVSGQSAGQVTVAGNQCSSGVGSSYCLKLIAGPNGSSNTDVRTVRGNSFNANLSGVTLSSSTGARFSALSIGGNHIVGGTNGLILNSPFISSVLSINDNYIQAPSTALNFGSITGSLQLSGNSIINTGGSPGILFANLPTAVNGSDVFVSDGAPASGPCTGSSTGSRAFRQNSAWKCF